MLPRQATGRSRERAGRFFVFLCFAALLAFGVVNLIRTDGQARSRSNKLMRMRVLIQFVAILLLVALGAVAGAFR